MGNVAELNLQIGDIAVAIEATKIRKGEPKSVPIDTPGAKIKATVVRLLEFSSDGTSGVVLASTDQDKKGTIIFPKRFRGFLGQGLEHERDETHIRLTRTGNIIDVKKGPSGNIEGVEVFNVGRVPEKPTLKNIFEAFPKLEGVDARTIVRAAGEFISRDRKRYSKDWIKVIYKVMHHSLKKNPEFWSSIPALKILADDSVRLYPGGTHPNESGFTVLNNGLIEECENIWGIKPVKSKSSPNRRAYQSRWEKILKYFEDYGIDSKISQGSSEETKEMPQVVVLDQEFKPYAGLRQKIYYGFPIERSYPDKLPWGCNLRLSSGKLPDLDFELVTLRPLKGKPQEKSLTEDEETRIQSDEQLNPEPQEEPKAKVVVQTKPGLLVKAGLAQKCTEKGKGYDLGDNLETIEKLEFIMHQGEKVFIAELKPEYLRENGRIRLEMEAPNSALNQDALARFSMS